MEDEIRKTGNAEVEIPSQQKNEKHESITTQKLVAQILLLQSFGENPYDL